MDSGSEGGRAQFNHERIEGAAFFDIDDVSDKASIYSHMLPSPQVFQQSIGKVCSKWSFVCSVFLIMQMGIANHNHIIVYDRNEKYGLFSAPRVWWMFRVSWRVNYLSWCSCTVSVGVWTWCCFCAGWWLALLEAVSLSLGEWSCLYSPPTAVYSLL